MHLLAPHLFSLVSCFYSFPLSLNRPHQRSPQRPQHAFPLTNDCLVILSIPPLLHLSRFPFKALKKYSCIQSLPCFYACPSVSPTSFFPREANGCLPPLLPQALCKNGRLAVASALPPRHPRLRLSSHLVVSCLQRKAAPVNGGLQAALDQGERGSPVHPPLSGQ